MMNSNQATSGRAQVNFCTTVQRMPERVEPVVMSDCAVPIGGVCASLCGSIVSFRWLKQLISARQPKGKSKSLPYYLSKSW